MTEARDTSNRNDTNLIYEKFHKYDFDGDTRFQGGWSKIVSAIAEEKKQAEYLKAKLFFYSRLYDKVTQEEYKQWLEENDIIIHTDERKAKADESTQKTASTECVKESSNRATNYETSEPNFNEDSTDNVNTAQHSNNSKIGSSPSETETSVSNLENGKEGLSSDMDKRKKELDFSEIAEMIEKGLKLPGIEELNIQPLNIDPKPSGIEKPKKPWEN